MAAKVPCEVDPRETFLHAVKFVLGNWPAIRIAVEQGFGGQYSNEKERWLEEVIFNLFLENERIDSAEVEDYLAEILSNEFNVIIEDDSLPKVSQKLCNYYQSCKNGKHSSVAAEIMSVKIPKLKVKYQDSNENNAMEINDQSNVAEQLDNLNLEEETHLSASNSREETATDANEVNGMDRKEETNDDQDGWVVVQRSKRKH